MKMKNKNKTKNKTKNKNKNKDIRNILGTSYKINFIFVFYDAIR